MEPKGPGEAPDTGGQPLARSGPPPLGMPNGPRPARRLRNVHPPHRLRKIASRGQAVPELVEIVREINLEVCNRLPVYASRSWLAFTFLKASQTSRFGMSNGFALVMAAPPVAGWPPALGGIPQPLRSSPHYRAFIPTTDCSVPVPRIGTLALAGVSRLSFSLYIGATGSRANYFHTRREAWRGPKSTRCCSDAEALSKRSRRSSSNGLSMRRKAKSFPLQ